jgi:hypothetical protein
MSELKFNAPSSVSFAGGDVRETRQPESSRRLPLKRFLASCVVLLSGAIHASAQDDGVFRSVYAARDVELDTHSQSIFWQGAHPAYAEVDSRGRSVPGYRTRVSSRWTKKNLYLLFECPYEELYLKPSPNAVNETFELWNWDVAELFIGSDFHNISRYKEFEVSPQGEWIDLDVNLDLPDHTVGWTWNSGFQVAARIDSKEKIWYGAMRIPFAALDTRPPRTGRTFRANLYRSQGPPERRKAIAWKAPMSDTFHAPEQFGLLKLVKDRQR